MKDLLRRTDTEIRSHPARVLSRAFIPGNESLIPGQSRSAAVIERVLGMSDEDVTHAVAGIFANYSNRHDDLRATFRKNFDLVVGESLAGHPLLTLDRAELIGSYFTQEYAIEGAALFSPSIVVAPDQSGCSAGELRFILSLRAVGEGHLSSIEFRSGILGVDDTVVLDPPSPHLTAGERAIPAAELPLIDGPATGDDVYQLVFPSTSTLSERVIFPGIDAESHGLEDARFIRFVEDDGSSMYLATYTAYNGRQVTPHMLQTNDFITFHLRPMRGEAALNKGMALFPRRINGVRWCVTRWDRENISVARWEDGWIDPHVVQSPRQPWEMIQLGACSSPIETPEGWLVLTHGVGPMRSYAIGAILLGLDDPTQVTGVLEQPLLAPAESERDGYVPNVVYSCGALIHDDTLVLPYGCSDASVRFAFVDLAGLLSRLRGDAIEVETS